MKNLLAILFLAATAFGQARPDNSGVPTPAEQSALAARQEIQKKPGQFSGYNHLAIALSRRARETSDVSYYTQAEEALRKSLELAPGNVEAEKIHVWLLLGRHEFPAALEAATALNKGIPDDVLVYGFLADANAELGNYREAESAVQWMLNLRPGNLPGTTRAAYLRELFGDIDGAYELMGMAFDATPPTETEDRAWILSQMGHLRYAAGWMQDAEIVLQQALAIFPDYHYALGNLAKVRIAQKRYEEAVGLLRARYQKAPHAENLYDLAEALQLAGRDREAKQAFAEFESKSLAESMRKDNSNRELIFYYADHAGKPDQALQIAEKEHLWRHDVYTLDAYAWALHVNGKNTEARKQMEIALEVGVRDAKVFQHAGQICEVLGDHDSARRYLAEAAALQGGKMANTVLSQASGESSGGSTRE